MILFVFMLSHKNYQDIGFYDMIGGHDLSLPIPAE
jgi:hypothetical protein